MPTEKPISRAPLLLDGVVVLCAIQFLIGWGYELRGVSNIDLPAFYRAVQLWVSGTGSPYDFRVFNSHLPFPISHVFPYVYPPYSFLVLSPLALVSYASAQGIWLVLNHLLVLIGLGYLWLNGRRQKTPLLAAVSALYVLNFNPLHQHLLAGQVNLFVLALLLVFWKAVRETRWPLVGGFALALAVLLKTYPIFFLAYLVLARRWKTLSAAVAGLLLALALSLWLVPKNIWLDWYAITVPAGGYGHTLANHPPPANVYNQGLAGLFGRLGELFGWHEMATVWTYLICGTAFATTGLLAIQRLRSSPDTRGYDDSFLLFLLVTPLVTPYTWEHHLVMILPACLRILADLASTTRPFHSPRNALAIAGLLLVAATIPYDHPGLLGSVPGLILVSLKTAGVLSLWLYVAAGMAPAWVTANEAIPRIGTRWFRARLPALDA